MQGTIGSKIKKSGTTNTSFLMTASLYERWKKRLPKFGDRSKVLNRLVEMFLDNEVQVTMKKTF